MKIDFRQTKYLLPAVMLIPVLIVVYLVMDLFGGGSGEDDITQDTSQINATLPTANAKEVDDKYTEMVRRYGNQNFDSWSEIDGIKIDDDEQESIGESTLQKRERGDGEDDDYIDDEIDEDDEEPGWDQSVDIQRLEEALARSRAALAYDEESQETPEEMRARIRREVEAEAEAKYAAANPPEVLQDTVIEKTEDKVEIVVKASSDGASAFNTIGGDADEAGASLIRAMIDQTTKAQDGTRLRFKLLDDVVVQGQELKKGTNLYGTVVGFSAQRVKVAINSIFANGKFIKVKLAAYDVDGMEGFYVPASAFREFMRDAAGQTAGTSLQISNGYGSAITGEMLALQAIQNVYNAASSAAQGQIRKNKAKIKYNTIVYLINSESL